MAVTNPSESHDWQGALSVLVFHYWWVIANHPDALVFAGWCFVKIVLLKPFSDVCLIDYKVFQSFALMLARLRDFRRFVCVAKSNRV